MRKIIALFVIFLVLTVIIYNYYPVKTSLPEGITFDSLVVKKSKRQLLVFSEHQLIKTYDVALGGNPVGDKKYEGDKRTPEGLYVINDKNANSGFHKNLGLSYPNKQDLEEAKAIGLPPGGDIKIHGLRNGLALIGKLHRLTDWTNGCIALTNDEMDELYAHTPIGTPIRIEK